MATIEEFIEAGLFDPEVDQGTGRLELLQWLDGSGFTVAEMTAAYVIGALGALAGERKLMPESRLSDGEAQELIGVGSDRLAALAIAFGFVGADAETDGQLGLNRNEAETLLGFQALATMFSEEEALGFARVVGASISRIAEAGVALFLTDIEGPSLAASIDELKLAKSLLGAIEALGDFIPMLDPVIRRHVLQAIDRSRSSIIDERERLQYRYAVGFVDLVGFTPLSQDMAASELGVFLRDFEAKAHDAVTAVGARLVKLIGDEVMFVAPDPDSAFAVARILMTDLTTADGRTVSPRGGVAFGPVLVRGGDYYGDVVNVASRLADAAEPSQLLVTAEFASAAADAGFSEPEERMLKGFETPVEVRSCRFGSG